jgi:hypothetical protein
MTLMIRASLRLCAAAVALALAAAVMASAAAPASAETDSFELDLGHRTIQVTLSYPRGEDAWAGWARQQVSAGVPALEEAAGHPYPGPGTIRIGQRTDEALHGYAGTASCRITYCNIELLDDYDGLTLLHELAHLWAEPFAKRWLNEGYAEFASLKAAGALGLGAAPFDEFEGPPFFPLSDWGEPLYLSSASIEAEIIEYAGYEFSYEMFVLLEREVGAEALKATNSRLFAEEPEYSVGSRLFMDTLEDTSGKNLDQVFAEWVFPPDSAVLLAQRREARDRLAAIEAKAEELGLAVNPSIGEHIAGWRFEEALAIIERNEANLESYDEMRAGLEAIAPRIEAAGLPYPRTFEEAAATWDFADVLESLPAAEQAIEAYTDAAAVVGEERSFWQQVGLVGEHPGRTLEDAAAQFGGGRFQESKKTSESAVAMIEGAGDAAKERVLFAAGLVIVLAAGAIVARRYLRDEAQPEGDHV